MKNNKKKQKFNFSFIHSKYINLPTAMIFLMINNNYIICKYLKKTDCSFVSDLSKDNNPFKLISETSENCGVIVNIKPEKELTNNNDELIFLREVMSQQYIVSISLNGVITQSSYGGVKTFKISKNIGNSNICKFMKDTLQNIKKSEDILKLNNSDNLINYIENTDKILKLICIFDKEKLPFSYNNNQSTHWTIFTKTGCPSCESAKSLLTNKNIPYNVYDCIKDKDFLVTKMNSAKNKDLNFSTWPRIFDNTGLFIGGFTDLQKLKLTPNNS